MLIKILISSDLANPSENYWQLLAERRRVALMDTLEQNKILRQRIEKLKEENREYKEMLDETKTLIEVLQVMFGYYTDILVLVIILNVFHYFHVLYCRRRLKLKMI